MINIQGSLTEIRDLLAKDRLEEAELQLQQIDSIAIDDPDIHLERAQLYEEAGMISCLIKELNLALRDAPDNTDVLKRLAEIYMDRWELKT